METFRTVVSVSRDRKIEIPLPDSVPPGLVEVVVVLQPVSPAPETPQHTSERLDLFGFLPVRVEPLAFQQQLREEWDE
jgi:hypothetical protein